MAKTHRGKGLWKIPGRARGTCPVCARTGIKLLYPLRVNGETVNVCKNCRNRPAS
jgi:hypothetical protein